MATRNYLTYAGYPFRMVSDRLREHLDRYYPLAHTHELSAPFPTSPRNLQRLSLPRPPVITPRPNDLYYPTGATRWASFRGLMAGADVAVVSELCYASSTISAQTFEVSANGQTVSTPLLMLPPRPVADVPGAENDSLYLVTLVDERFYWQAISAGEIDCTSATSTQTWADLLAVLASALGITLTYASIESAYGYPEPDSPLFSHHESAAQLLEACAHNLGRVLCRNWDGTYELVRWDAANSTANGDDTLTGTQAGGVILPFDPAASSPARAGVLPGTVVVTFPRYVSGSGYEQPATQYRGWELESYNLTYALTYANTALGSPYSGLPVQNLTQFAHTSAKALLSAPATLPPTNLTALQALAEQIAKDVYNRHLASADLTFPGIYEADPLEAWDMLFAWSGAGKPYTRICRLPFNLFPLEFQHGLGLQSSPALNTLTIEEASGTPTYANITTLQFDQTAGFTVSQPGANTVLVSYTGSSPPPPSPPITGTANTIAVFQSTGSGLQSLPQFVTSAASGSGYTFTQSIVPTLTSPTTSSLIQQTILDTSSGTPTLTIKQYTSGTSGANGQTQTLTPTLYTVENVLNASPPFYLGVVPSATTTGSPLQYVVGGNATLTQGVSFEPTTSAGNITQMVVGYSLDGTRGSETIAPSSGIIQMTADNIELLGYTIPLGSNTLTGTLPAAQLPQFTGGNVTTSAAGSTNLVIGAGVVTNAMLAGSIATGKLASVGVASGLATLDSGGHLTSSQIPTYLQSAASLQGTWNASTNSPTLASGTGTKGYMYIVSTAGTTTLDGISSWSVGDWAIFTGTVWEKLDGLALEVQSVAGRTGNVTLSAADISGLGTAATYAASAFDAAGAAAAVQSYILGLNYAPLASPSFTGTPVAPTQTTTDNSTRIATTAFVRAVVAAIGPGPGAPTGLTASAGNGQVTLSWTAPGGTPAATSYVVEYGTSSTLATFSTQGASATSATITGLTNGTTEYFAVYSLSSSGAASGLSSIVSATPSASSLYDQFAGTAGTVLTSHTPNVGGPWYTMATCTSMTLNGNSTLNVVTNEGPNIANISSSAMTATLIGYSNYNGSGGDATAGVIVRADISDENCYMARVNLASGSGTLVIYQNFGTLVASVSVGSFSGPFSFTVKLQATSANTITATFGSYSCSYTDTSLTSNTYAGIYGTAHSGDYVSSITVTSP